MLSFRFIAVFFLGTILLAWIIPRSWMMHGTILPSAPKSEWSSVVSIEDVVWANGSPYARITIQSPKAPVMLSDWSLENERGERAEIGLGATTITPGKPIATHPITLSTTTTLFVNFSASPLGASFQEHICSPYLRGTQPFVPPMTPSCPDLRSHPLWGTLDAACQLLVSSLPQCTVVSPEHLADVTSSCNAFLRSAPTYTSCINHTHTEGLLPLWRIYLASTEKFVTESGGTLILKDDREMVVDIFPYHTIGIK